MDKQSIISEKTEKLINSLVKYLDDTDKAEQITTTANTGKGSTDIGNNK